MISAYCPSHATCFFRPADSCDIMRKGSKGVGIRLKLGTNVNIDEMGSSTKIFINGRRTEEAKVTQYILEQMAPRYNFEVDIRCDLPIGQGFGTSASGAIALAMCLAEITGRSREDAFGMAHQADITCGGGLGDVAGLMSEVHTPIRKKEGLPPFGEIMDAGVEFKNITLATMGPEISTKLILLDEESSNNISAAGDKAMLDFFKDMTKEGLFKASNEFAISARLISPKIRDAITLLRNNGISSAMCMLGNSLIIDASEEEVKDLLGTDVQIFGTGSTAWPAQITRRV